MLSGINLLVLFVSGLRGVGGKRGSDFEVYGTPKWAENEWLSLGWVQKGDDTSQSRVA